ncbi:hypothetical protein [Vampirovibrio sp.]|uniref:hypothetical protein n=1 Tax=Vampirovibrio sp. TaxID=2717857 RepID=UPI0035946266
MKKRPELDKLFSPEVVAQTRIALSEIGEIKPWFDAEMGCWCFEHPLYPESYGGESASEVEAGYPLYLAQLIEARMSGELAPFVENLIKGRGGKRHGAGRPKGSHKGSKKRVYLPVEVADWLMDETHLAQVRNLMQA